MRAGARTTTHRRGRPRRCSILLALVVALLLPASVQAATPSLQGAAGAAVGQLQQPVNATAASAQGAVGAAPAAAATSTQPVIEHVAQTAATAAAPARPAVEAAARGVETAAPQAVSPADAGTTAPVHTATPPVPAPAPGAGRDRSARRSPSHAASPKPRREPAGLANASHAAESQRLATADGPAASTTPSRTASASNGAAPDREPPSQDDGVQVGAGSMASAFSTSFSLGALALLSAALLLAAPAAGRRLRVDRAFVRPTLFVSVLERPG
jgi:hypothetical protein